MCDKRSVVILRRVGVVAFAVLFALLLPVCAVFCVLNGGFSSLSALAEDLVDQAYLISAEERIRESFEDISLLYGIESERLTVVLDENREVFCEIAVADVQSLLSSAVGLGSFEETKFDAAPFRAVLEDYAEDLAKEQGMEVQQEAIEELSTELSTIVSESLSPVGGGLFREAAERLQGIIPTRLFENLGLFSVVFLLAEAVLLGLVFWLSRRAARLSAVSASLFCGATLCFVPTFFLLPRLDVSSLVLTDGVLIRVIRGLFLRFSEPLRVSSIVLLILATVLLLVSAVLNARTEDPDQTDGGSTPDVPAEDQDQAEEGSSSDAPAEA